jgi:spore germination protein Q
MIYKQFKEVLYMNYPYGYQNPQFPTAGAQTPQQSPYGYGYPAYPNPNGAKFPTTGGQMPGNQFPTGQTPGAQSPAANVPGMLPIEQSYIENILRLNKGKVATVYMSFENNAEWSSKVFRGVIEAAGRDHIILSDPQTGRRYLLLMIYLDYITFDDEIDYEYPYL